MKKLALTITFFFCLLVAAFAQPLKSTGVWYFQGVPNTAPASTRSIEIAVSIDNKKVYVWDRIESEWVDIANQASLSSEEVEDIVADLLVRSSHDGISISYDDLNGTLSIAADVTSQRLIDSLIAVRAQIPSSLSELTNDVGYISNPDDADADPINEIQTLDESQLNGTDLELSLLNDGEATKVIDLSPLQDGTGTDDQTASEVAVSPITNLTATDVQAALSEHQNDIDALAGGAADGVASAGVVDLANDEIDITVDAPGSNFSIDIAGLAKDSEIPTGFDAADIAINTTGLEVIQEPDLQSYIIANDAALLKARGTEIIPGTGKVTINSGDNTAFDVTAASGQIKTQTGYFAIEYAGATAVPVASISAQSTWVYIDTTGTLSQQTTAPTPEEYREKLFLARLASSGAALLAFEIDKNPAGQYTNSVRDLSEYVELNHKGFNLTPNANLTFATSNGSVFKFGANADFNPLSPHTPSFNGSDPVQFFLLTQDANIGGGNTLVPVDQYDDNGTLTNLTNNRFVIHTVYFFTSGNYTLQYGQNEYASIEIAQSAIATRDFTLSPVNSNGTRIGWIIVQEGASDLSNSAQAKFIDDTGQASGASGAAGALLASNNLSDVENATTARANIGAGVIQTITGIDGITIDDSDPQNVIVGGGGSAIPARYLLSATAPDTTTSWIDVNTDDGTGVYRVKEWYDGTWNLTNWFESIQGVFSNHPPMYLANSGQSNSLPRAGAGVVNKTGSAYSTIYDPIVDAWVPIDTEGQTWMGHEGNNWYVLHIGFAAAEHGVITKFVHAGRGGRPIDDWLLPENSNGSTYLPDPGGQWDTLATRIAASGIPYMDAVFFTQGETDGILGRNSYDYGRDWYTFARQLQNLPQWRKGTTKLIAAETLNDLETQLLADGHDEAKLRRWDQASSHVAQLNFDPYEWSIAVKNRDNSNVGDSIHLDGEGHVRLGYAYWEAAQRGSTYRPLGTQYTDGDSVMLNFEKQNIAVQPNADYVLGFKGAYDGWSGQFTMEDNESGLVFDEGFAFCYSDTAQVNLGGIYGSFSSGAALRGDTLYFNNCPADYDGLAPGPIQVGNIFAWYDASQQSGVTDGDNSAVMTDFSGNSRTMNQVTDGADWVEDADGKGNPAFDFNGVNESYLFDADDSFTFMHNDSSTVFAVYSASANDTIRALFGGGIQGFYEGMSFYFNDNTNPKRYELAVYGAGTSVIVTSGGTLQNDATDILRVLTASLDPANATPSLRAVRKSVSGVADLSTNTASVAPSADPAPSFAIGDFAQTSFTQKLPWKGRLYEFLVYDRILTDAEVIIIQNYLERKYNITLN